jgi:hypothetical protein
MAIHNSSTEKSGTSSFKHNVHHIEGYEPANLSDIDRRLQKMSAECPRFYKNHDLLILYLLIIPGCLVPSTTLGFDSAMMNGLQAVPAWDNCKFDAPLLVELVPYADIPFKRFRQSSWRALGYNKRNDPARRYLRYSFDQHGWR